MQRLQIRELAELMSDTDSQGFPLEAHKNLLVSEEAKALYAEALNIPGFPGLRSTVSVTLSNAASYTLALTQMHRVTQVRLHRGAYSSVLSRVPEHERATSNYANTTLYYDLELDPSTGWILKLYPPNGASGTVQIDYLRDYAGLPSDTSELYLPDPCGRLVAARAALRFIEKIDKDPRIVANIRDEIARLHPQCYVALGSMAGDSPVSNQLVGYDTDDWYA